MLTYRYRTERVKGNPILHKFNDTISIFVLPMAGYVKSRQAVANFYSSPEAPLTAEVTAPVFRLLIAERKETAKFVL